MVYTHVTYEGGELAIKAMTITISTRRWSLQIIRPAMQYTYYYSSSDSYSVYFTLPGSKSPTSLSYKTPSFIDASGWYKDGQVYYPITKVEFTEPNKTIKIYYLHPQNGEISSDAIPTPADIHMRTYFL